MVVTAPFYKLSPPAHFQSDLEGHMGIFGKIITVSESISFQRSDSVLEH